MSLFQKTYPYEGRLTPWQPIVSSGEMQVYQFNGLP